LAGKSRRENFCCSQQKERADQDDGNASVDTESINNEFEEKGDEDLTLLQKRTMSYLVVLSMDGLSLSDSSPASMRKS